jgi:hypothetical protein
VVYLSAKKLKNINNKNIKYKKYQNVFPTFIMVVLITKGTFKNNITKTLHESGFRPKKITAKITSIFK